eukprot:NODE_46_length_3754_cov_28.788530_g42_i0.p1 GENE.NODE_46_length_3754_cov_28.788530_g42_i0~~NODE_46_length_3754_cov_28.788530_g42_i0.p1  ORF type:complete len:1190 (-),score=215.05 NODE_46_length_3754_cov_28.788530_g42_i0:177-3746(-)
MLLIFLSISFLICVLAMPASSVPYQVRQPDGTVVELRLRGSSRCHFEETLHSEVVIHDTDGWILYAVPDDQKRLISSGIRVPERAPANSSGIFRCGTESSRRRVAGPQLTSGVQQRIPQKASGVLKNLVIPLRFSDHQNRTLPSIADLDILFNSETFHPLCPTGSVRMVYQELSYGKLTVHSEVQDWIDLKNTEAHYAEKISGDGFRMYDALIEGLEALNTPGFFRSFDVDNDHKIDAITFLHSGYGAEHGGDDVPDRIWSHQNSIPGGWDSLDGVEVRNYHINPALWYRSGSEIGHVGVIVHEIGHFLDLPDLYDIAGLPGYGIGTYDSMANSWGFDFLQLYPPHFCSWSKIQLGWVEPTVILPGTYSIPALETHPVAYRIDANFPAGEYLLIENRQAIGLDALLPQGGLAIYHIDERAEFDHQSYPGQPNFPDPHYQVALLQADGLYHLEKELNQGDAGDLWHGGGAHTLNPFTVPNTQGYQTGKFVNSGVTIMDISVSGTTMSFTYSLESTKVDACLDFPCAAHADCLNINGPLNSEQGRHCVCQAGFEEYDELNGCRATAPVGEVDACLEFPCAAHAECYDKAGPLNSEQGRDCVCQAGFEEYDELNGCRATETCAPQFRPQQFYEAGAVVQHKQRRFRAKWWTGDTPDHTNEWGAWEDLGLCHNEPAGEMDACLEFPCAAHADCHDKAGSLNSEQGRDCVCQAGFEEYDAINGCRATEPAGEVDACLEFPCAAHADCHDKAGPLNSEQGRDCVCQAGFEEYDAINGCRATEPAGEMDACLEFPCAAHADCHDKAGSLNSEQGRDCVCQAGFEEYDAINGCRATAVNACLDFPCAAHADCFRITGPLNSDQGRHCVCHMGFEEYDEINGCRATETCAPQFRPQQFYEAGAVVQHKQRRFRAKWWTGDTPDHTNEWGAWEDLGLCHNEPAGEVDACLEFPCAAHADCNDKAGSLNSEQGRDCVCQAGFEEYDAINGCRATGGLTPQGFCATAWPFPKGPSGCVRCTAEQQCNGGACHADAWVSVAGEDMLCSVASQRSASTPSPIAAHPNGPRINSAPEAPTAQELLVELVTDELFSWTTREPWTHQMLRQLVERLSSTLPAPAPTALVSDVTKRLWKALPGLQLKTVLKRVNAELHALPSKQLSRLSHKHALRKWLHRKVGKPLQAEGRLLRAAMDIVRRRLHSP